MAFGSGTLLSAIAFEITLKAYRESGLWPLLLGFVVGGSLFVFATKYIDQQGAFLRKPASRRRYLFQKRQEAESELLDRLGHVEVMRNMPPAEAQAIVPLLKPVHAETGEVLCQEGTSGDSFYLIIEGEAQVLKGGKVITTLGPGEVFGEMALLTKEPRSATIVALSSMELYQLKQADFNSVLTRSPHLATTLSRALARRLQSTTKAQLEAEQNLDRWRQQVLDSMERDSSPVEEQAMLHKLAKSSAPLAILIGTLIDNIPESTVIGMTAGESHFNGSFLLAVFISNFPEALSSSTGMKQAGTQTSQILGLWSGVVVLSGLCAVIGNLLESNTSHLFVTLAEAVSGGAMLAMLASTMMPEAYELGGGTVAFSTIAGFLTGFFVSSSQL
jgi:CRP-like cAMP-binding protein